MADKPKRFQSQTERDFDGLEARAEREREGRDGRPAAIEFEEITGQHHGAELRAMRASRPPEVRLERMEDKHDELVSIVSDTRETFAREVGAIRTQVGKIEGKLDVLPELVSVVKGIATAREQREHLTFTAQVEVDQARKLAEIEKEKDTAVAEKKAELDDRLDKKKSRRKLWIKILGGVGVLIAGAIVHAIIHSLTGWL